MRRIPLLPDAARPLLFAHRGLTESAPENTLAAFRMARDHGVPGIELDVHLTADGRLAVIHDDDTARIAAHQPAMVVERISWQELSTLAFGAVDDWAGAAERVPLLDEVFEDLADSVYYDIELKCRSIRATGMEAVLARTICDAISRFGLEGRVAISSFNPIALARLRRFAPRVPLGIIWSGDPELPAFLRHGEGRWPASADFLKPQAKLVKPAAARRWLRLGHYDFVPWTVDTAEAAARMTGLGAAGIISNRADRVGLVTAST